MKNLLLSNASRLLRFLFTFIFLSYFSILGLQATNYYVSNSGNDTNDGLTLSTAFKTIQHASDLVMAGDSVLVENGTYVGFDHRNVSGTANAPIVFKAMGDNVLINTSGSVQFGDGIYLEDSNYLIIDGFMVNDIPMVKDGIQVQRCDNMIIRNCIFDNNGDRGIHVSLSHDVIIENNVCSNSIDEHGIYVTNSSDRPIIRFNECYGNTRAGIHMNGDFMYSQGFEGIISDAKIYGNVIHDNNGGAGINMAALEHPVVYNNLIYNNHSCQGIVLYKNTPTEPVTYGAKIFNNTIIVPSDGRWGINIWDGGNIDTEIYNNIIINQHTWRGCIVAENTAQLISDYNILNDKMSNTDDGSSISLSAWQALGLDGNSLLANPITSIFVSPNASPKDFHLAANSQAIDAGTNAVNSIVTNDIDGTTRPQGMGFDIGAYERQGIIATSNLQKKINYTLSPNPFSESAILSFENLPAADLQIKIFDSKGSYIKTIHLQNQNSVIISKNEMSNGLYFFQIQHKKRIIGFGKFIIQ